MPNRLTEAQITTYRANGFSFPFDAFDSSEAEFYCARVDEFEQRIGGRIMGFDGKYRANPHLLCCWANDLIRHRNILDVVEDLIGPDILLFSSRFFIKEPHSTTIAGWHQDAPFIGLRPHDSVYAWVALSDVAADTGPLELLKGSHLRGYLNHESNVVENSMTASGAAISDRLDTSGSAQVILEAGQFSLHHTCCVHQSGPNLSDNRRIAIALNYIPPWVRHYGPGPMPASLIQGEDSYGNFALQPEPKTSFDSAARKCHEQAFSLWIENYFEQVRRHEASKMAG